MKFVGPWTVHGCTVHREKVNICGYCSMNSAWTVAASLPETRENKIKKKKKTKLEFTNANAASAQSKQALY